MRRTLAAALAALCIAAAPAVARNDPPPAGLPLPVGPKLIDAHSGTSQTAYRWTASYATNRPVRALNAYAARLRGRPGVTFGPGNNLTFRFRRWQVFACADRGCAAPHNRLTIVVALLGG